MDNPLSSFSLVFDPQDPLLELTCDAIAVFSLIEHTATSNRFWTNTLPLLAALRWAATTTSLGATQRATATTSPKQTPRTSHASHRTSHARVAFPATSGGTTPQRATTTTPQSARNTTTAPQGEKTTPLEATQAPENATKTQRGKLPTPLSTDMAGPN